MPIVSGGGGGASLAPPVVITSVDENATVLTLAGKVGGQTADTLVVTDGTTGSVSAGGGGQALLTVQGSDAGQGGLRIKAPAGQTASALIVTDSNNNDFLNVGGTSGATLSAEPVTGKTELQITTSSLIYRDENGDAVLDIELGYVLLGVSGAVFVTPNNYLALSSHTAPADAELSAGDCAFWFDQTNGVGNTKLMVKAKSADGTVKTASIVLA